MPSWRGTSDTMFQAAAQYKNKTPDTQKNEPVNKKPNTFVSDPPK